jgi:hypothetical protein
VVVDENGYFLHADTTEYKKDIWITRQKMGNRIDSNSQNLSENRTKIRKENIEANADISTTFFEFELANSYMKAKLVDYKPCEADK